MIAIENVRLFDEVQAKTRDLTEALTYQTGSGNILKVIASSPTDVEPVLKAIVESACELCEADRCRRAPEGWRLPALQRASRSDTDRFREMADQPALDRGRGRSWTERRCMCVICSPTKATNFPIAQELARHRGHRSILSVPLLREGESIGVIVLRRTRCSRSATSRSSCCRPSPTRP